MQTSVSGDRDFGTNEHTTARTPVAASFEQRDIIVATVVATGRSDGYNHNIQISSGEPNVTS